MQENENVGALGQQAHFAENLAALMRSRLLMENRRRLGAGLTLVLLIFSVWWATGWLKHHLAQARLRPSRAAYEHLLAQTRAALGPDGTIVILDPNGTALSLSIDYWKEVDLRPSIPFTYEFELHYDDIAISPEDNPWNSTSDATSDMDFVPTAGLTLKEKPDASLSEAIDKLVNWSIADAQSGAKPRNDVAASDGSNAYFVRCDPAEGYFYLLLRQHLSHMSLQSMQGKSVEGYVIPVTNYHRAHLWRYLIDHYADVKQIAESYLSAKRGVPEKSVAP